MVNTQTLSFLVLLSCLSFINGWQQAESEYNDDSLAMMPGNGWKENAEKRNTWWTKKSVNDDEIASDMLKNNVELSFLKKSGGCSIEKCMMMLIDCLRRSENRTLFLQCKDAHIANLAICFQKYK